MRVLIADDSVVSRRLLEGTLRRWEYDVVVASDGTEAWNCLQRPDSPPLAILDWMMPGMTGPEICRLVRQAPREPYTYILLLTSKSQKEDLIEGMGAGADDYITKPFDQHELNVRLRAGRRIVELQSQLLEAREALREQATRDFLTRCWNRSSILDILARELTRALREQTTVGVVMADLDHFKNINDTHGHAVGDAVLCEAARRMQSEMRSYDSLGRYGGEEFLIVLPGCDDTCTAAQAERMRAVLSQTFVVVGDRSLSLTASFGCSTSHLDCAEVSAEQYIRLADEALYESKRHGRNCVTHRSCSNRIEQLAIEGLVLNATPA